MEFEVNMHVPNFFTKLPKKKLKKISNHHTIIIQKISNF